MVQLSDIALARYRLSDYLQPTPLEATQIQDKTVWLKLENANRTHSFKIRGAMNAMLSLNEEERAAGVVAASSGNHAQGVAYAAKLLGVKAQILMPQHTPRRKVNGVRKHGAEAVLFGETYDETEQEGLRRGRDTAMTWISPYNDARVIAGAGTIGLELLDTLPDVRRVLVCVSGGGLISGIGVALKSLNPLIEVVGVGAASAPALFNAKYGTHLRQDWNTLAEALSGEVEEGSITLKLVRDYVDSIELVSEEAIARAMRWMLEEQGWVVEGGGVVAVAALLSEVIQLDNKPTAVIVSGGNVDLDTLKRVIA